jgi:4-hydroxybenzoate polyprenyltransferase
LELIRFSHTIFALPFAILAGTWAWLLNVRQAIPFTTWQGWTYAAGVILCMVSARSFAMSINRLVDRKIDAQNPRTASRHLPSGQLSIRGVILFAGLCAAVFVCGTSFFLPNRLPLILSLPVLLFLAGYSFAKRWTIFVHFWLGAALGLAPICAWIAIRGTIVQEQPSDLLAAGLVGLAVFFWVSGFDIIYACQDTEVDRRLGLKSLPARLGNQGALRLAAILHGLLLIPLAAIPFSCPDLQLSWLFGIGFFLVGLLLSLEHRLVSADRLDRVNLAFFHANAIISLILLTTGVVDAFTRW